MNLTRSLWRFVGGSLYTRAYRHAQAGVALLKQTWSEKIAAPMERDRTFQDKVAEYQLSEADLHTLYRQHTGFFYVLVGCALFTLGFSTATAFSIFGFGGAGVTVLMALLFLAKAAAHSLRCWQLQERRLRSFREWLQQPRCWFPLGFS